MPRIGAKIVVEKDDEGNVVDRKQDLTPSQGGLSFAPINAGFYTAIVRGCEMSTYRAGAGKNEDGSENKNPDSKDGKWEYVKIRPTLHILNDGTISVISRHDLTVGVIVDNQIVRADGKEDENPVFGGYNGARFFLKELGFFHETEEGFELVLDTDLISNMVLRVRIAYEVYCKEDRNLNMNVDEFKTWLTERGVPSDAPIELVYDAINSFNEDAGFNEDEGLRLKSVPIGFYALQEAQATELGFYYAETSKQTFVSEEAYNLYAALLADESAGANDEAF